MNTERLLELRGLCIDFGDRRVVSHLDLSVARGETVAVVGESGSGKSVSALGALDLLPSGARITGEREFEGRDLARLDKRQWSALRGGRIGFIFQEPMTSLNPLHTVGQQIGESLRLHQGLRGSSARTRSRELLESVKLPRAEALLRARPHQLSGGQRQRVMIAMAIANDPALLIADEPTTALDVTVQRDILALLDELRRVHHMGLLLISHDLNLVRRHADRVVVMHRGAAVESGSTQAVFTSPRADYTRHLLAAVPDGRPQPLPGAVSQPRLAARELGVEFARPRPLLRPRPTAFVALEPLSLAVAPGETLGIVGESGSGKSTLANALIRLLPSRGEIDFEGQRLDRLTGNALRRRRRDFQIVFQDPYGSLSPRMPVADLVSEGLRFHHPELDRKAIDERIRSVLREVGLPADCGDRYPHEFSGGQRQRIAIARALVLKPKLLVLDEPTSALDRTVQKQLITLLREVQSRHGISYLFISHDLAVVRAMAHRILVLKEGRVIETGPCEQLLSSPQSEYTRTLVEAAELTPVAPDLSR
ncbi:ABC transporter ATP-binding protein [Salinicola rhizosphaerae]|uniref:ABC-type dipeptide transporter n=1 Tax=Salinicola rhizosphaerae TaxID=1443141 RepID=A0ABQ3DN18_9GAMM|nr:dipeptide ABC transporter ATP-binding protein [Salinicola rhizosphaerae]GHB08728.1 peptide ABC transporter ATP-binding protein [Salinicola rhizosphaerae]